MAAIGLIITEINAVFLYSSDVFPTIFWSFSANAISRNLHITFSSWDLDRIPKCHKQKHAVNRHAVCRHACILASVGQGSNKRVWLCSSSKDPWAWSGDPARGRDSEPSPSDNAGKLPGSADPGVREDGGRCLTTAPAEAEDREPRICWTASSTVEHNFSAASLSLCQAVIRWYILCDFRAELSKIFTAVRITKWSGRKIDLNEKNACQDASQCSAQGVSWNKSDF